MKAFRCIVAAVFAFYSILSGFPQTSYDLGIASRAIAAPMSLPIDRECTAADAQFTLVADSEIAITVTNTSDAPISVLGVDANQQMVLLGDMTAGEKRGIAVPSGIVTLGFSQNGGWLGEGYVITGTGGETVSVPYTEPVADAPAPDPVANMLARQQGPGSVELSFSNSTAESVRIWVVDEANKRFPLYDVSAGETATQKALPQAKLYYFTTAADEFVNGPYVVSGTANEVATITPQSAEVVALKKIRRQQSGDGSVELSFSNTTADAVTVTVAEADVAYPLFDVPAGGTLVEKALPQARLVFYRSGTEQAIGLPHVVAGTAGEVVTIAALSAEMTALLKVQAQQSGEGSVELAFTNSTADTVTVTVVGEANTYPLFDVPAGTTVTKKALPQATLVFYRNFYQSGSQEIVGAEYVVAGADSAVAIPILSDMQKRQSGEGSVALSFTNTTSAALRVAARDEEGKAFALFDLPAAGTLTERALPGTTLAFFDKATKERANADYIVRGTANETVSLPFDPAAIAKAEQSGPGSTELMLTNRHNFDVVVAVKGVDGKLADLRELGPLSSNVTMNVLPGTELRFLNKATRDPLDAGFTAQPRNKIVSVPYVAEIDKAQAVLDIPFDNKSGAALTAFTVITEGDKTYRTVVFDLPVNFAQVVPLPPKTKLWFFKTGTEEEVPQGYTVPDTNPGVVVLPYTAPGAIAETLAGPGSKDVSFVNRSNETVTIGTLRQKEGSAPADYAASNAEPVTIYEVQANQSITRRILPGTAIWFYRGQTNEPSGRKIPYFVRGKDNETVTLPYNPSDNEVLELTNISIDKIVRGHIDDAEAARLLATGDSLCWRNSFGRGVGTVPRTCPAGMEESTAGLCYTKCRSGYTSNKLTMCIPGCPSGFRDDGLYCAKPGPYAKTSFAWKFGDWFNMDGAMARCRSSAEGRRHGCGIYNSNTMVYTGCPSGYQTAPFLNNLCSPKCPSDTTDIGVSCQKRTYDRGVGQLMSCEAGKHYDAGLCYNQCGAGSAGVGPVCWNICPANLSYNCGAMCARDKGTCDAILAEQVLSPVLAVGSVVLTVVTAGGSTGAVASAKAGAAVAKTGAQVLAKAAAKELARQTLKASVRKALASTAKLGLKGGKMIAVDTAISVAFGGAIYGALNIAAAVGREQLRAELLKIVPTKVAGEVSDERIAAIVDTMMEGAEKNAGPAVDIPWTALDPTGIADIVIAYNYPICSDLAKK